MFQVKSIFGTYTTTIVHHSILRMSANNSDKRKKNRGKSIMEVDSTAIDIMIINEQGNLERSPLIIVTNVSHRKVLGFIYPSSSDDSPRM